MLAAAVWGKQEEGGKSLRPGAVDADRLWAFHDTPP